MAQVMARSATEVWPEDQTVPFQLPAREPSPSPFAPVDEVLAAFARGEIVVVVDDEDRENEGDLIMAAEFATPDKIAFFLHHTSGVICAPVTRERARELDLPLMVAHNTEAM